MQILFQRLRLTLERTQSECHIMPCHVSTCLMQHTCRATPACSARAFGSMLPMHI